jgi:hypothetical protein
MHYEIVATRGVTTLVVPIKWIVVARVIGIVIYNRDLFPFTGQVGFS